MRPAPLLALLLVFGCDSGEPPDTDVDTDTDQPVDTGDTDVPPAADAPDAQRFAPGVVASGGLLYVLGEDLLPPGGDADDVTVSLVNDQGGVLILEVIQAESGQLVARLPADAHEQVPDGGFIFVTHAGGSSNVPERVFVVERTGLGDDEVEPGQGTLGTVYALFPDTPELPDLLAADPCTDATIDTVDFSCPQTSIIIPRIDIPSRDFTQGFPGLGEDLLEWFAIDFSADLRTPVAGTYTFRLCSDDGSELYLDAGEGLVQVVDNDGVHGFICETGSVDLPAGEVPMRVLFFQGPRTALGLTLEWTTPGSSAFEIIPNDRYRLDLR